MASVKYDKIYQDLLARIKESVYRYSDMLPSENKLSAEFNCSRNTIRRAIEQLAQGGYVQSIHGKGVQVIHQHEKHTKFTIGGIESLKEAAKRNNITFETKVISFVELVVDRELHDKTLFALGEKLFYVQRIRYIDGDVWIIDHNYLLANVAKQLTSEIAERSIYDYLENQLGEKIVTTKRKMTVEKTTALDEQYMEMCDYNCVAVVSGQTYNHEGVMFEYTESRHHPLHFAFYSQAHRIK